ncbi:polysaccharide deacetylase family protein [Alkalicoccus luteus]|uniref:polysaccharide deacetylase family protein n=1 Tax=Alkalicoccus luteus TaxID=1237094 RepID=UPI00403376AC
MKRAGILAGVMLVFVAGCADNNGNGNEAAETEVHNENNDQENDDNAENEEAANTDENDYTENEMNNDEHTDEADMNETDDNTNSEQNEEGNEEAAEPAYYVAGDASIQPLEDAEEEIVLMTIDDAPDNHGVQMAEALAEMDTPAIFFVNGHFITSDEGKEQLEEIYELGFEIGNHTMSHPNLSDVSAEETEAEIVELNDMIEEITGERPRFFRAPFGVNTDASEEIVEAEGMQSMNWTYGYDWEADYMEAGPLAEIMVETENLRSGANLLMHDREHSLEALEDIVEGLRGKGYDFVDPDEIE